MLQEEAYQEEGHQEEALQEEDPQEDSLEEDLHTYYQSEHQQLKGEVEDCKDNHQRRSPEIERKPRTGCTKCPYISM